MVEKIERFSWKETLKANIGKAVSLVFGVVVFSMAISIIAALPPEESTLKVFGLLGVLYFYLKMLGSLSRISVVYELAKGGYIRYD